MFWVEKGGRRRARRKEARRPPSPRLTSLNTPFLHPKHPKHFSHPFPVHPSSRPHQISSKFQLLPSSQAQIARPRRAQKEEPKNQKLTRGGHLERRRKRRRRGVGEAEGGEAGGRGEEGGSEEKRLSREGGGRKGVGGEEGEEREERICWRPCGQSSLPTRRRLEVCILKKMDLVEGRGQR